MTPRPSWWRRALCRMGWHAWRLLGALPSAAWPLLTEGPWPVTVWRCRGCGAEDVREGTW